MRFDFQNLKVDVLTKNLHDITINGTVDKLNASKIFYLAPNPPDLRSSFSGSALPFPNKKMAFDNTPNHGVVDIVNNSFSFAMKYPNSYYQDLGSSYTLPTILIKLLGHDNNILGVYSIPLNEKYPFRNLSYQTSPVPRTSPNFYERTILHPRSQENILKSSAYPTTTPPNFWGDAVPHP